MSDGEALRSVQIAFLAMVACWLGASRDVLAQQSVSPLAGTNCTVLIFVRTDCPIANKYAPEIGRIAKEFTQRGVSFYLVYAEDGVSAAKAEEHRKSYQIDMPFVIEGVPALVARAGATVTPEAVVFNSGREVVYRGRINDQFAGFGQQRIKATSHDLRDALAAVLDGKKPVASRTKAVGCYISLKP